MPRSSLDAPRRQIFLADWYDRTKREVYGERRASPPALWRATRYEVPRARPTEFVTLDASPPRECAGDCKRVFRVSARVRLHPYDLARGRDVARLLAHSLQPGP